MAGLPATPMPTIFSICLCCHGSQFRSRLCKSPQSSQLPESSMVTLRKVAQVEVHWFLLCQKNHASGSYNIHINALIVATVNDGERERYLPQSQKKVAVGPLLKKPSLDLQTEEPKTSVWVSYFNGVSNVVDSRDESMSGIPTDPMGFQWDPKDSVIYPVTWKNTKMFLSYPL